MADSSQSAQRHTATVRDGFSGWRTAGGAWRDGMPAVSQNRSMTDIYHAFTWHMREIKKPAP
jgi:hypothetical protein